MRSLLLVATLGVGGCYPFISGGVDENVPPEQALLVGSYSYTTGVGDYWSQIEVDPDSGSAYFGVFNEPHPVHPWNEYALRVGICEKSYPDPDWLRDFDDVGSGTTTLQSGGVEIELTWNDELNLFASPLAADDYAPNSVFSLQPTTLDNLGQLSLEQFVRNPSDMTWTAPDLDTNDLVPLSADDLTFTWTAPQADAIVIVVRLFKNGATHEEAYCLVENTGSFTLPTSHWSDFGDASFGFAFIGQFLESFGPLDFADPGVGYRVTGEQWHLGAFEVQ